MLSSKYSPIPAMFLSSKIVCEFEWIWEAIEGCLLGESNEPEATISIWASFFRLSFNITLQNVPWNVVFFFLIREKLSSKDSNFFSLSHFNFFTFGVWVAHRLLFLKEMHFFCNCSHLFVSSFSVRYTLRVFYFTASSLLFNLLSYQMRIWNIEIGSKWMDFVRYF